MKKTVFFLSFLLLLPNILVSMDKKLEIPIKSIELSCNQIHLLRCTGLMHNNKLLGTYKHGCVLSKVTFNTAVQIKEEVTNKQLEKLLEYFDGKPFKFYCPTKNTSSLEALASITGQYTQTQFMSLMAATPREFRAITYSKYDRSTTTNQVIPTDTLNFHTWSSICLQDNPTLDSLENIKNLYIQHAKNASARNVHCISSSYSEHSIQKQASLLAVYHEEAEYMILYFIALPEDLEKYSLLRKTLVRKNLELARNKLIYSQSGGLATLIPYLITGVLEKAGFSEKCKYLCANITPNIQEQNDEEEEKPKELTKDDNGSNESGYFSLEYWWPTAEKEAT